MPRNARFLIALMSAASLLFVATGAALANDAVVKGAKASANGDGTYSFTVTVSHADTGWKHYADKFEVLDMNGKVLGTRVLYHPHENEQPFTRSLGRVQIPIGITEVRVRAHDKVHGDGKTTFPVKLPPRR